MLPTARHRCNMFSREAVLPGRNDSEMGPNNSLHASAYYSKYTKIWFETIKTAKTFFNHVFIFVPKLVLRLFPPFLNEWWNIGSSQN